MRVLFEHAMLSSICICITSQNVIFTELYEFLKKSLVLILRGGKQSGALV
jgi:hypothetical protein